MAARTALEAVDAASAPSPRPASQAPGPQAPRGAVKAAAQPLKGEQQQGRTVPVSLPQRPPLGPALRAARAGVTAPLRRASRALWYELTGSFFALFAFSFGAGLWHSRANALSASASDRHRFYAFCALALLFAYFAVSSFVRAKRGTP